MYCRKCGARIRNENEFCPKCGAKQTHLAAQNNVANDNAKQVVNNVDTNDHATGGDGDKKSAATPNKSLIFIVLVVLAIGGYMAYNHFNKKDNPKEDQSSAVVTDSNNESPSDESPNTKTESGSADTNSTRDKKTDSSTDAVKGVWWSEAVTVEGDIQTDGFMVVADDAAVLGLFQFKPSTSEVVNSDYEVVDVNTLDLAYDSSKDEVVVNQKTRFKRANDAQTKIVKALMEKGQKTDK